MAEINAAELRAGDSVILRGQRVTVALVVTLNGRTAITVTDGRVFNVSAESKVTTV